IEHLQEGEPVLMGGMGAHCVTAFGSAGRHVVRAGSLVRNVGRVPRYTRTRYSKSAQKRERPYTCIRNSRVRRRGSAASVVLESSEWRITVTSLGVRCGGGGCARAPCRAGRTATWPGACKRRSNSGTT